MAGTDRVTLARLEEVVAFSSSARTALRASGRTASTGPSPIRYLSRARTSDRVGDRAYQRGDPISLLIWRELALRGRAVVRTYREFAEVRVLVVLDGSRSLLDNPRTARFAVQFAASLLGLAVASRAPVRLAILGADRVVVTPPIRQASELGIALEQLASVEPEASLPSRLADQLAQAIGHPRNNVNAFVLLAPGSDPDTFESILRLLAGQVEAATVFPIADEDDLLAEETRVTDPETGRSVELSEPSGQALERSFRASVTFGRSLGVRVEPMVVRDPDVNVLTVIETLAWL